MRGRGERTILLCAHLDTVPAARADRAGAGRRRLGERATTASLAPTTRRRWRCSWRSRGAAASRARRSALELLFTVAEEVGLQGAKRFDVAQLQAEFGYVFDHATPIGEIVTASPTLYRIEAEFHGKSAHAGLRPEEGRSAILAAAHAAARCRTAASTRDDREPRLPARRRGVHQRRARARPAARRGPLGGPRQGRGGARRRDRRAHDGASHGECDVDVITEKQVIGYRQQPSSPAVVAAEAALRAHGYEPKRIATGGASDANVFEAAGIPCVNVANGTQHNHEPTERVSVAALESMLDVGFSLLEEAAAHELTLRTHRAPRRSSRASSSTSRATRSATRTARRSPRDRHPPGRGRHRRPRRRCSSGFVRQPREAIGVPDLLEIPAGKLDEEGEDPLETAKRELAEEIGKQAADWEPLARSTPRRASRTRRSISSWPPASPTSTSAPRSRRTSGSTSRSARWSELDAILAETRTPRP